MALIGWVLLFLSRTLDHTTAASNSSDDQEDVAGAAAAATSATPKASTKERERSKYTPFMKGVKGVFYDTRETYTVYCHFKLSTRIYCTSNSTISTNNKMVRKQEEMLSFRCWRKTPTGETQSVRWDSNRGPQRVKGRKRTSPDPT